MNNIREDVFHEVARIAKKNVVMFEAFKEWNDKGLKRDSIYLQNYFQGSIDDMIKHGLYPIYIKSDIPSKLKMRVGLAIFSKEYELSGSQVIVDKAGIGKS